MARAALAQDEYEFVHTRNWVDRKGNERVDKYNIDLAKLTQVSQTNGQERKLRIVYMVNWS